MGRPLKMKVLVLFNLCVAVVLANGPCTKKTLEVQSMLEKSNGGLPGARVPDCQEDGYYKPKQCSGSRCYCVSKDGDKIEDYGRDLWDPKAKDMTCKCARDQHEYFKTGMLGLMFDCEDDGAYKKVQCLGSVCFCADEDGHKQGNDVPIHDADKLKC